MWFHKKAEEWLVSLVPDLVAEARVKPPLVGHYWRDGKIVFNLGDFVTDILVEEFGYKFVAYENFVKKGSASSFDECLFACGSIIDTAHIGAIDSKIVVWGSGSWGDPRLRDSDLRKLDIRAVRGPRTLAALQLSNLTPLGDPAILLPLIFPIQKIPELAKTLYVPHFYNRGRILGSARLIPDNPPLRSYGLASICQPPSRLAYRLLNVDDIVDIVVTRDTWLTTLQAIGSAKFVLTNSLHAAIIAQAYQVPWAVCLPFGAKLNWPEKWLDWLEYLGITDGLEFVSSLTEGWRWWKKIGQHGRLQNRAPLLSSFPYPILNADLKVLSQRDTL